MGARRRGGLDPLRGGHPRGRVRGARGTAALIRPRILGALFRKDVFDAIRDSRVLVSVLLPVLIGLAYNALFEDEQRTRVTVAYAAAQSSAMPEALRGALPADIDLRLEEVADGEAVRARVRDDADVGLVIPAGFDAALREGRAPSLSIVTKEAPGGAANAVVLTLDGVLRAAAGQRAPVTLFAERVSGQREPPLVAELGLRRYMVLGTVTMLIGFIGLIVVPIILAEEVERLTIDALTLVASTVEVVAAKALVGLAYSAVSLALLLAVTRLAVADIALFAAAAFVLALGIVGFGLVLGSLFNTAAQAYTWSGFFLIPVIAPPFFLGIDVGPLAEAAVLATPTAQATRVAANAIAGKAIFSDVPIAFAIMAAWAALAYALVVWRLRGAER